MFKNFSMKIFERLRGKCSGMWSHCHEAITLHFFILTTEQLVLFEKIGRGKRQPKNSEKIHSQIVMKYYLTQKKNILETL